MNPQTDPIAGELDPEVGKTTVDVTEDLAGLDGAYGEADADDGLVPPGVYQAKCVHAEVCRSQRTGSPQLRTRFEIVGPAQKGRMLFHTNGITEKSLPWLKTDLVRMGLELDHLQELAGRCEELIGRFAEVRVVHKPGDAGETYVNMYINRRIEQPGVSDAGQVAGLESSGVDPESPF